MKRTALLILALIMLSTLVCACGAPEQNNPVATKAPEQNAPTGDPAAMQTPESTPQGTPLPENTCVKLADLPYSAFFDEDWIANEIELDGSPMGVANTGVPGWTVANGKLYYICWSDGMLHCRDIASGEDAALFNAAEAGLAISITYCNDMIYSLHRSVEEATLSACKLDGTAVGKIEIPKDLYSILADPSRPSEDPYVGWIYMVKYEGEFMLAVYCKTNEFNYYSVDFSSGAVTPCEAPYTISWDDDNNTVVTYRDGSSVTLSSREREMVDCIGENGDIYCTYYYEPGNHEYRRYSSEGELLSVSRYGDEYSPHGEELYQYTPGGDGCLYFMGCSDESIMLVKVPL